MIRTHRQLADYAHASLRLLWQRQAMYVGGTVLVGFYVAPAVALLCFALCQLCELYEIRVCQRILDWEARGGQHPAQYMRTALASVIATSMAISIYVGVVAVAEGPSLHLAPIFFLFAAALYATMSNAQVPQILRVRLRIYSAALLAIPLHDLILVNPPLHSPLWIQLGTVVVMLFVLDQCARKFSSYYRRVHNRLDDMRQERDRVTEAYELQAQFLSIVSHELRTPLTSIKASLDLIADESVCSSVDQIREIARIGQRNGTRLATLINDLLDFQKLDAGKMVFQFEPVDLSALLADAVEANRALGEARGIALTLGGAGQGVWVNADADRLMQVLANVLSNAVKFSHEGGVVDLRLSVGGGQARIAVRDYGVGIPASAEAQVFAPFVQVDASDKRAFGGTGLGMSISKRIMDSHGGSIGFESGAGKGTTFEIVLDLMDPGTAAAGSPDRTQGSGVSALVFGRAASV